jgi:hypothetical protein
MDSATSWIQTALDIASRHQISSLQVHSLRTFSDIKRARNEISEAEALMEEASALAAVIGLTS